jgi:hypothetical protein
MHLSFGATMKNIYTINKYALDEEWERQPRLYYRYAKKLSIAKRKLREAEGNLEVVDAELDLHVRTRPSRHGLESLKSITEKVIANAILRNPKHQRAQRRVNRAKHRVDVLQVVINTLEHRKKALSDEVELFGMNYFSIPTASRRGTERMQRLRKRSFKFSEDQ